MSSPNALPRPESRPPLPPSHESGLSKTQRVLLDLLRTSKEMAYTLLCQTVNTLPLEDRLSQADLDNALFELVRIGHLTSFFEDGDVIYMVQTSGARPPSKRDEQMLWNPLEMGLEGLKLRRSSSLHKGINRFDLSSLIVQEPTVTHRTPIPGIAGIQRFNIPQDLMINPSQPGETQEVSSISGRKAPRWSRRSGSTLKRIRMGYRRGRRAAGDKLSHSRRKPH